MDVSLVSKFLNSNTRPEIKSILTDSENEGIGIYCQRRLFPHLDKAVFRFDFVSNMNNISEHSSKADQCSKILVSGDKSQRLNMGKGGVRINSHSHGIITAKRRIKH